MASDLRIGTSGWSYPTGRGTWNGVFYPLVAGRSGAARRGAARGIDELAYYAEHFDTVEVNSSFYRPPAPNVTASWARRTPRGFEFSLKLYQKFTHPAMFAAATKGAHADITQADVDTFRAALDPLAVAGKLGALLAQFPPSFKQERASLDHLDRVLKAFAAYPVAVELRHRSWSDDVSATLDLLNARGAAWAQIDEPKFRTSIRQNFLPNVTTFYYLRLHGRNAAQWWAHEAAEDRYDYLYSADELKPFVETADAARRLVKKLYLYTNNHFEAKSVANATMIKSQLGEPISGTWPESFVERYPELRGVLTVEQPRDGASLPLLDETGPRTT